MEMGNTLEEMDNKKILIVGNGFDLAHNRKRQTMRQSLKSTPPIIGDVASCIRPEDYLTMA